VPDNLPRSLADFQINCKTNSKSERFFHNFTTRSASLVETKMKGRFTQIHMTQQGFKGAHICIKLTSNCSKLAYTPLVSFFLTVPKSIGLSITSW